MRRRQTLRIIVALVLMCGLAEPANAIGEQSLVIAVKSFIARMGPPDGQRTVPPSEATKKALGFEGEVANRSHALLFMYKTDDLFSEDPKTADAATADYRLWSSLKFTGSCDSSGNVSSWYASVLEMKFGTEGSLDAVGQVLTPVATIADGRAVAPTSASRGPAAKSVVLTYAVKGRPNGLTLPLFIAIRPRACIWIWHRIAATVSCTAGKLKTDVKFTNSAFPSVRAWSNGVINRSFSQGPFENLWKCDDSDSSLVK